MASIFTDSVVNNSPTERTYPFIDPSDEPGVWDYNFRRLVYYGTVEDTRNQVDRYAYMETNRPNMWSRDGWVKPLDQWGLWPGGSLQDGTGVEARPVARILPGVAGLLELHDALAAVG